MNQKNDEVLQFTEEYGLTPELYSVKQVCTACGILHAMLISMKKDCVLIPRKVNPETGYHWYDLFDVAKVQQHQILRTMGLSQEEIKSYYGDGDARPEEILEATRERLRLMQRGVEEFAVRLEKE